MDTCLFTGQELTATTKEEHTIPEALGGRIKSRVVTSDTFNNLCGTRLDFVLKLAYEPILNQLAPLLPKTSQPGLMPIDVPGEQPGLFLDGGKLTRQNIVIVEKDETGRPKAAVASDAAGLKKLARSMGKDSEDMKLSEAKATEASTFYKNVPTVCREIEMAVLKSALLTFDHLLRGSPHHFTRLTDLEPVRTFIREAVETRQVDSEMLHNVSLGLQYEKIGLYKRLREQLPTPPTPFEHILFVAADLPTKTLDLVWLVFGFDPFGFRLCRWEHDSFAYAVVNPVMKDAGYSGPHSLNLTEDLLCRRTNRCSLSPKISDKDEMQPVFDLILQERRNAYGRAVMLVETTCDENLIDCFREAEALSPTNKRSVACQVRARLVRMFGRKKDDRGFLADVDACISKYAEQLPLTFLSKSQVGIESSQADEWTTVVRLYRDCLNELQIKHGLPGDICIRNASAFSI